MMSKEDRLALDIVKNSKIWRGGRYEVAIPWMNNKDELKYNYVMAYNRLKNTEKGLRKEDEKYKDTINDYQKKGYIK